jgi:hypothetical protein
MRLGAPATFAYGPISDIARQQNNVPNEGKADVAK